MHKKYIKLVQKVNKEIKTNLPLAWAFVGSIPSWTGYPDSLIFTQTKNQSLCQKWARGGKIYFDKCFVVVQVLSNANNKRTYSNKVNS